MPVSPCFLECSINFHHSAPLTFGGYITSTVDSFYAAVFVLTDFCNETATSFIFIYVEINDSSVLDTWEHSAQMPREINWAEISPKPTACTIGSTSLTFQWFKEGNLRGCR